MKTAKRTVFTSFALALLFGLLLVGPVKATSFTTDLSDLWGDPDESGWGIQFVQQHDVIFATMYVYDQAGNPVWYIATLNNAGGFVFTGDLLTTHGPWFGTPVFNPALATIRKVGQMTFTGQFVESGALTYSIDGVSVSKTIERTTFRLDNYAGNYLGAYKMSITGCSNPALNRVVVVPGTFAISQSPGTLRIATATDGETCTYSGDYIQSGQFGSSSGSYSCSTGETGTYGFFEMNVSYYSVSGRLSVAGGIGCKGTGTFAGLRLD